MALKTELQMYLLTHDAPPSAKQETGAPPTARLCRSPCLSSQLAGTRLTRLRIRRMGGQLVVLPDLCTTMPVAEEEKNQRLSESKAKSRISV